MKYGNELEALQKLELEILRKIDVFCRGNNIEYFIIGGTCLGAVRHGGFIPWDDDIDIGMTRDNYLRFLALADKLEYPLFLQSPKTEKKTPYLYTKIRYTGTKFVEYCNRKIKMNQGIYIDVFPFDNIPDDDVEYSKSFSKIQKLLYLNALRTSPDVNQKPNTLNKYIKAVLWKILHLTVKIIPKKYISNKIEAEMTKYNNIETKAISCWFFPGKYKEYGTRETIFPLKECDFAGVTVLCPNDTDTYLKNHYGNYSELPPVEQRIGHKPYVFKI